MINIPQQELNKLKNYKAHKVKKLSKVIGRDAENRELAFLIDELEVSNDFGK